VIAELLQQNQKLLEMLVKKNDGCPWISPNFFPAK
jgi:hypothetical protein